MSSKSRGRIGHGKAAVSLRAKREALADVVCGTTFGVLSLDGRKLRYVTGRYYYNRLYVMCDKLVLIEF